MINYNGTLLSENQPVLLANNRGLAYGDAVFETIKVSGGKVLFWEDHYFRLMAGMRIMRMEIPMEFTPEYLEEQIRRTLETEDPKGAYGVKIQVWRQAGGKYTPLHRKVEFLISFEAVSDPFYMLKTDPYEVELFKDHYVNSGLLSTIKSSNRIVNVLGGIFAQENDYENCLLLNEKKQVVEALNGNLFLVNGYTIKTPPLEDGCLNGIMRKQIISILGQIPDLILDESSVTPFELQKADEMFITNTLVGIRPVSKYRKKEYGHEVAKDLLSKVNVKARLG